MPGKLPDPPPVDDLDPSVMTAAELRDMAEKLWSWLEKAHSAKTVSEPEEEAIDEVTLALNEVTRERRRRHSEEFPMRGS
jgi:hypothetical protein